MSDFKYSLNTSDCDNPNFREEILRSMHTFKLSEKQLASLLNVEPSKIEKIVNNEDVSLDFEEELLINYRMAFLADGFSIMEPLERLKMIIDSVLVDRYGFSHDSLARYANVPLEIFELFYGGTDIDKEHLASICVNLQMLVFILTNTPNMI